MAIGRVNTSGGTTGATLTVTGVAGDTVTITKDSKTYTRTFNSDGVAVFKGLATGTWSVTMTNGTQTATRTVEVTAEYEVEVNYTLVVYKNTAIAWREKTVDTSFFAKGSVAEKNIDGLGLCYALECVGRSACGIVTTAPISVQGYKKVAVSGKDVNGSGTSGDYIDIRTEPENDETRIASASGFEDGDFSVEFNIPETIDSPVYFSASVWSEEMPAYRKLYISSIVLS